MVFGSERERKGNKQTFYCMIFVLCKRCIEEEKREIERIFKTLAKKRYHFRQWPMKINIICRSLGDTTQTFLTEYPWPIFRTQYSHTHTVTLTPSPFKKCEEKKPE